MEKEINMQTDMNAEIPKEIMFSGSKYLHSSDGEYDYLVREKENGIKVTLVFTNDVERHKKAMKSIKKFFSLL